MGDFNPERLAELAALLGPLMKQEEKKHVPDKLQHINYAKQAEFNCKVLNVLERARRSPEAVTEAIKLLTDRNKLLTIADKDSSIFAAVERAELMTSLTASSAGGVDTLMIASLLASTGERDATAKKRKREDTPQEGPSSSRPPPPQRPFRMGGSDAGRSEPRSSSSRGPTCYACGATGHFSRDCRQFASSR